MKKILIIAAYNGELKYLANHNKKHISYLATGIGSVAATYGLSQFLAKNKPNLIISLNTAGVINTTKLKVGEVVLAKKITPCSHLKGVYTPSFIQTIKTTPKKHIKSFDLKFPNLKPAQIYCPQEISSSISLKNKLSQAGHDVETMETYAYHYVANQFNIPIISLLGLTNHISPKAHDEWVKNESWVCQKMSDLIKNNL